MTVRSVTLFNLPTKWFIFHRYIEDGAGQSGRGGTRSWKTWEQWVSVAVALMTKSEVLPVIVP